MRSVWTGFALVDRINLINPPYQPNYWQQLLKTYQPRDKIPGVVYDP